MFCNTLYKNDITAHEYFPLFQAHQQLLDMLDSEGFDRVTESFSTDPEPALTNLKVSELLLYCSFNKSDHASSWLILCDLCKACICHVSAQIPTA